MEISLENMMLIEKALDTQVRLINSYVNKDEEQQIELIKFKVLLADFHSLVVQKEEEKR